MLRHLWKIQQGERTATTGQLFERVGICEALNAEAVAGVQLLLQEFCASIPQSGDLKEAGGLEDELDVLCSDEGMAGVNVLQKRIHSVRLDAVDLHHHLTALPVVIAEHGTEVAAAGRQHGTVTGELAPLDTDDHVREEAAVAELVEDLEDALRVRGTGREVEHLAQGLRLHFKDFTFDHWWFRHASRVLMIQTATQNEHHDCICQEPFTN